MWNYDTAQFAISSSHLGLSTAAVAIGAFLLMIIIAPGLEIALENEIGNSFTGIYFHKRSR